MQSNFCSAILNSHCCKPVSSPCKIDRAEIYRILNEKAGVFAVCAPAGYGKTSMLSGWAEQANAKICWLSLDFDANNYHRFWTYMITAFSLAYKKYPTEQLLRELNEKTSQEFIIAFLNSLASNTVIILDDFHYIILRCPSPEKVSVRNMSLRSMALWSASADATAWRTSA